MSRYAGYSNRDSFPPEYEPPEDPGEAADRAWDDARADGSDPLEAEEP